MAAWRKKEKPLTPAEALALARIELASHWHGSKPLLAGVVQGGKVTAIPLDDRIKQGAWIFAFLDPTDPLGSPLLDYVVELHRRYSFTKLNFLVVLKGHHRFLIDLPASVDRLIRVRHLPFVVAADFGQLLWAAFGATDMAKIMLLSQGQVAFQRSGRDCFKEIEYEIQEFVRKGDPGLPLMPLLPMESVIPKEYASVELGYGRGFKFPCAPSANGDRVWNCNGPGAELRLGEHGKLQMTGQWVQQEDRIWSTDPAATLRVQSQLTAFQVVAQGLGEHPDDTEVIVEVSDGIVPDIFSREDISNDDDGNSIFAPSAPRLYDLLGSLTPAASRSICLRFPLAPTHPVAIYGVRIIGA